MILDDNIRKNKLLFFSGICFLIYSIIEIGDCIFIILILFNSIPNYYSQLGIVIQEMQDLIVNQPLSLLPFFLGFTLLRIMSTIGILKNRYWGIWIGVFSLILTMIFTMLLLPIGCYELFFCTLILIMIIIGYYGKNPIIK